MTQEEMKNRVLHIVENQLELFEGDIDPYVNMRDNYNADSFDMVCIATDVEKSFGISISDEAISEFETMQDIVDEVERNILD